VSTLCSPNCPVCVLSQDTMGKKSTPTSAKSGPDSAKSSKKEKGKGGKGAKGREFYV